MRPATGLFQAMTLALAAGTAPAQEARRYQGKTAAEWVRIVNDKSSPQRKNGVEVLRAVGATLAEDVGAPAVVAALVGVLKDPDPFLRGRAADGLGNLHAKARAAVPALVEAVRDREDYVRGQAAAALGEIGPAARAAVPALVGALRDPERVVRDSAAESLKKIDPGAARKAGVK